MSNAYVKFWGTRGSNPTADNNKMKYGGDTSCVEILTKDNDSIILDMGTGIRNLGKDIISNPKYPRTIHIFFMPYTVNTPCFGTPNPSIESIACTPKGTLDRPDCSPLHPTSHRGP